MLQGYGWEGLEAVRSWCSAVSIATSWNSREVRIANCCARYVVRLVPTLNCGAQVRSAAKFIQCNRGLFGSFQHRQLPSRLHEQRVRLEFEAVTRQQGFYIVPSQQWLNQCFFKKADLTIEYFLWTAVRGVWVRVKRAASHTTLFL